MENETPGLDRPDTSNFLKWVEIKNFKSIKDLRLDCKRVNIFIGKPNVGKSNILEGLGLLGAGYGIGKFAGGFVRYEVLPDLFYDRSVSKAIQIYTGSSDLSAVLAKSSALTNKADADFSYEYYSSFLRSAVEAIANANELIDSQDERRRTDLELARQTSQHITITKEGKVATSSGQGRYEAQYKPGFVKKYDYDGRTTFEESSFSFLLPPSGTNLYSVVNQNEYLKNEFAKLFIDQRLELVLSNFQQNFEIQKREGFYVNQYPYFSIADTFRRYMFYVTAIESNKNSVIIFEEPEVHSFPPYVKAMAHRIAYSEQNQFFIATHSPYLLQTLIDELDESELAVYITYYKDYQTQVRQLTAEELQEARDLSIDLFYNLSRYEPNA